VPLYIVRWPNLTVSIVRADDEQDLIDTLDEVDDPGCAQWEEYDGPLWVEFASPFDVKTEGAEEDAPLRPQDLEVSIPPHLLEPKMYPGDILVPATSDSDTYDEMTREIVDRLFPHLSAVLNDVADAQFDGRPLARSDAKKQLRDALSRELEPLLKYSWRRQAVQRKGGVMARVDVTIPTSPLREHSDKAGDDDTDE
jgi:hypothetical protein